MGKPRSFANFISDNNIYVDVANDRIGIGTTNPQYKLDVAGDINFTGTFRQNGGALNTLNVSGVSTFGGNVELNAGIKDFYDNVGVAGSILVSTGAGVSWTAPFAAGIQGAQDNTAYILKVSQSLVEDFINE